MNLSVGLEAVAVAVGVHPHFFVDRRELLLAVASMAEVGGVDTTWHDC